MYALGRKKEFGASRLLSWKLMKDARIAVHVSSTSMLGTTDPDQINR